MNQLSVVYQKGSFHVKKKSEKGNRRSPLARGLRWVDASPSENVFERGSEKENHLAAFRNPFTAV